MSTPKRIALSIIIALVAWGLLHGLGILLTLVPVLVGLGLFVQAVSLVGGILVGAWFYLTNENKLV